MKLPELHDRLFELLCLIDDICKKENVKYFLHAGTELGSVREKDFIPWDDDADIKVMLEDYPAFKKAMLDNLPDHIKLIEPPDFAPAFYDFIIRIVDTRCLLRKETDENNYYKNLQNHIDVDVMLQHKMPNAKIPRAIAYSRLMFWYGLGMGHRYKIDFKKYPGVIKIIVAFLSFIGKFVNPKTVWNRYFKLINVFNKCHSTIAMRNTMLWSGMVNTEWTDNASTGIIRGREFPIPAGYDAELTSYYGDYKTAPKDRSVFNQHLDEEDRYKE